MKINLISRYLLFLYFCFQTIAQSCNYVGNSGCDPRCKNLNCNVVLSSLDCCNGCNTVSGVYYYLQLTVDPATYIATASTKCVSQCPAGQYPINASNTCGQCHILCQTCSGGTSNTQCLSCATNAYKLGNNQCYNLASFPSNPCPAPYYGLQISKTCVSCAAGCTNCNINLLSLMPSTYSSTGSMNSINCYGDPLCEYTLKCNACNMALGYFLEEGFCFINSCRKYQLYNSTSITFSASACYCMTGYYMTGSTCSRCSLNCLTCDSSGASVCLTCPTGSTLNSASKVCDKLSSTLRKQQWGSNIVPVGNGTYTISKSDSGLATTSSYNIMVNGVSTATTWLFGYSNYNVPTMSLQTYTYSLSYSSSSFSSGGHYGVHVRATFLFIDSWQSTGSIIFRQSGKDVYSYNYLMANVLGQYICGMNTHDHIAVVDFWFPHDTNVVSLYIGSNTNLFAWGMNGLIVEQLGCDISCVNCDGPGPQNCTSCSAARKQVYLNGDCVCDIANNYYLNAGSCMTSCDANLFKDNSSRSCVATCAFPNMFYYSGMCYEKCPSAAPYRNWNTNYCLSTCFNSSISDTSNFYKYNGTDLVCYQTCPYGMFGDPQSKSCVSKCPSTSSLTNYASYGSFADGKYCSVVCSGSKYAFLGTRTCNTTCLAGFYINSRDYSDGKGNALLCEAVCRVDLNGYYLYGDNTSIPYKCVNACLNNTYADIASHMCVGYCNTTAYKQSVTLANGSVINTCQTRCDVSKNIFGNNLTHQCVAPLNCPNNTYGDYQSSHCVFACTHADYYGNNDTRTCNNTCSPGLFKQRDSKVCLPICPKKNLAGNPEFGDNVTFFCETSCSGVYYADSQNKRLCVKTCAALPTATFGLLNQCVTNCSSDTWADPQSTYRVCTQSCSQSPLASFGYNATRYCVKSCPNTLFGQIINGIPLCISKCELNQFGHPLSNLCVANCPAPYYGDPNPKFFRTCVLQCQQNGYYALNLSAQNTPNLVNRTCVTACPFGWADDITRKCAMTPFDCSAGLFAHETNHKCVPAIQCAVFADPITRKCVQTCFSNTTFKYYGYSTTKQCLLICPTNPNLFGDNTTSKCQLTCQTATWMKDTQNMRRCVVKNNCSRLPVAYFGDLNTGTCVVALNCSTGTYGDNNTKLCQYNCQQTSLLYADPVSLQCVDLCQLGWFAINKTNATTTLQYGICVRQCPYPFWADNKTVQCTSRCSANTYGVNHTIYANKTYQYGTCDSSCRQNQYARDSDNRCVENCSTDQWGQKVSRRCLITPFDCPTEYYGEDLTHMCVLSKDCQIIGNIQYYADNLTKKCVSRCPEQNVIINYADTVKRLCVAVCPLETFGDNTTLRCLSQCKTLSNVWTGEYADFQLRICVRNCSALPIPTYGQNNTYTCVQARLCPTDQYADDQYYDRVCVLQCPDPDSNDSFTQMFADPVTKMCVYQCPNYYFGNIIQSNSKKAICVSTCPPALNTSLKFADNSTKLCVLVCPLSQKTFGDPLSLTCVKTCPLGYYSQRDPLLLPDRYCVQTCDLNTWKNQILRKCVQTPFDCPTINNYHWYALDGSTSCVEKCPDNLNLWGQNSTYKCVSTCLTGFKYSRTQLCIDICPSSLDDDGLFSDGGTCYPQCPTGTGKYRDPQNARSCQTTCSSSPVKYYADDTTMKCVLRCPAYPSYYYAYDPNKRCQLDCPLSTMKDSTTQKCVSSCPSDSFFDPQSDACVSKCPSDYSVGKIWYGDSIKKKCVQDSDCTLNYYSDDNLQLCVQNCSQNQWISLQKNCVVYCPDGFYGDISSASCVQKQDCPNNQYADNATKLCMITCSSGTFGYDKECLPVCPSTFFADPSTRLCTKLCTNTSNLTLYSNIQNRTCVSSCAQGLFLNPLNNNCESGCFLKFADPSTNMCVDVCPSVPPLFGDTHTYNCVQNCNNTLNQYMWLGGRTCVANCPGGLLKNNFTRYCVSQCYNNTYAKTIYCVYNCTPLYSLNDPNICTSLCPSPYFKDTTTYQCVLACPTSPIQHFQVITQNERRCSTNCPPNQYRSYLTFACVSLCSLDPPTYADTLSGNCTVTCSATYYAHKPSRTCMPKCPEGMFADPLSRLCVTKCLNGTKTYGDSKLSVPQCVYLCSYTTYANPITLKCDSVCNQSPIYYGFDNTTDRICLRYCPYPYIADNSTQTCKLSCLSTLYPYLDKASKSCVSSCSSPMFQYGYLPVGQTDDGSCVTFCPPGFFTNFANNTCVSVCPDGYFGETDNNTCYKNCTLANNRFADRVIHMCVDTCTKYNASYDSFADLYSRQCVTACPTDKSTIKDNNTRQCQPRCTHLDQYADWSSGYCVKVCYDTWYADLVTQTCVKNCSLYSQRYIYENNKTCVTNCLDVGLFQNEDTRTCVTALDCPDGFWGLISTGVCVNVCPTSPDLFGDQTTQTCVNTCPNKTTGSPHDFYADFSTRICVKKCPSLPALFARNDTRRCVAQCPVNSYADNFTRNCIAVCSIIPGQTFADNTTNQCVAVCPTKPNYFSQNNTWTCVKLCPTVPKMYADYSTRKCVKFCPTGLNFTYADEFSRFCTRICLNNTFKQNSTLTCNAICVTGFADPITRYCIEVCPPYTYGYTSPQGVNSCLPQCPLQTPALYAEDANNLCMGQCLSKYGTYRDSFSGRCVKICPISKVYFAENNSRICLDQCPQNYYADYSSRFCVSKCPSIPALFAILDTRICTLQCPNNSWADNKTRNCVIDQCPSIDDTYGDNSTWTCVKICPSKPMTWSDDFKRQCVSICPSNPDYYSDNFTRRCVSDCKNGTFADSTTRKCVQTCPLNWFGVNNTGRCEQVCPDKSFADKLLRLCVKKCSVDPIFYGNPDTHICTDECPALNISFGNPLSQQCVKYLLNGTSGCPDALFAENISRLCVPVCPLKQDTYGDKSTWKCVSQCPGGLQNTFSDNSTMSCVKECPTYPQYYAEKYSRRCVSLCLDANQTFKGSFSDNSTRLCVETCPSTPDYFSENSTRRCVFFCPRSPLTFADNQTRRCVARCPSTPDIYGDLSTLRCVPLCPEAQLTFADNSTRMCVKLCPAQPSLYANNATGIKRCVPDCPNGTYADNSSRFCVFICPQYPDTYADPSTNKCVTMCPPDPDLYADPLSQKCVLRCPSGYYAQNDTRRCLPQCPQGKINYADDYTNSCVKKCPSTPLIFASYGDNRTQNCVSKCPKTPFTYADNITRICLIICNNVSNGGYAENISQICVQKCPDLSYGDITTRYCVRYCPNEWYAYTVTNLCVKNCPFPFFSDPTTSKCVQTCPVSQLLFGQSFNRTCIIMCPQTTYADFNSQECVEVCPSKDVTKFQYDTFGWNDTNECVEECPIPLYGYPVGYVCVDVCPDPYYQNITDHRCYKCPIECLTCNYPQLCLTCAPDHYLYAGACVQSCPTFPVITYANPNRVCGTSFQCTAGYFALNLTKSCVRDCPLGYFKNNMMQSCDSCQRGCSTCTNSSNCIICNDLIAIWYQFQCYTFCSPLRRFYTNTGCATVCPDGTFLNLTNCQACSSICKTCIVQPQNCILCAEGYYLQNSLCVQKCLDGYKAITQNGSLICKSCSEVNCTVEPLTYEVTQYVSDFKYHFQLKFSENVNISKEISSIISLKKTKKSRLLQTSFEYMDYTIIDYGGGVYDFILNDYDPSNGADQFQLQINDPSAIKSLSGQLPQTTRATIQIDSTNVYTLADYIEGFTTYCNVVGMIAVVTLVVTFWADYTIWIVMFDFMQLVFAIGLFSVDLPPTPMYAFGSLTTSFFTFLPNFFKYSLPQSTYNSKTMTNSIFDILEDFIFLRNMGQLFTILIAIIIILLVILVISKKFFNKSVKKWSKKFIKQTFWKKHAFNISNVLFMPIMLIALLNFRDYTTSTVIVGFSIFSSWLFMISVLCFIFYCIYKLRKLSKQSPITYLMIQKAYNFITHQKIVLLNNPQNHFAYQKNQVNLQHCPQPLINDLPILPFQLQTKFGPIQIHAPIFSLVHKFLIALFIALAYSNTAIQIFFCMLANFLYFLYLFLKKPYFRLGTKVFTTEIIMHNLIVQEILCLLILLFKVQLTQMNNQQRNDMGLAITVILVYGLTVNFVYLLKRTYDYYFQNLWKPFVATDIFKLNYTIQHIQLTKKYSQQEQSLKKQLPPRQQFLQAIKVQTGQALAGMVLRDPNHTSSIQKPKQIQLRPNKLSIIKSSIDSMFSSLHNQNQRSQKSLRSSQRLSKQQRQKVRNKIFQSLEEVQQEKYQHLKIQEQEEISKAQTQSIQQINLQEEQSQYQFQYIQEEYPENTPIQTIMKNCKGTVIIS